MQSLNLVINNDPQSPANKEKYTFLAKKALFIAKIHDKINETEQKRDEEYNKFQNELLNDNNSDKLNKIMLDCVEQCAKLRTLIYCSKLADEII